METLENICLNCIVNNPNDINIIPNLKFIPPNLARAIIIHLDLNYISNHKYYFINFIKEEKLDYIVLESIAYVLYVHKNKTESYLNNFSIDIDNITTNLTMILMDKEFTYPDSDQISEFINIQKNILKILDPIKFQNLFQRRLDIFNNMIINIYDLIKSENYVKLRDRGLTIEINIKSKLLKTLINCAFECTKLLENILEHNSLIYTKNINNILNKVI
jgi:hypothetical protein